MMDKMREEFEKWVMGRNICKKYGAKLNQRIDGSYADYRINDRWLAWKASRDSLGVLTKLYDIHNDLSGFKSFTYSYALEVAEQLKTEIDELLERLK